MLTTLINLRGMVANVAMENGDTEILSKIDRLIGEFGDDAYVDTDDMDVLVGATEWTVT